MSCAEIVTFCSQKPTKEASSRDQPEATKRKYLVLDLDETLIHSRPYEFEGATISTKIECGGTQRTVYVSKRPGLDKFLNKMTKYYTLVLLTAGTKEYAHAVIEALNFKYHFKKLLHRGYCRLNAQNQFEKDISILGIPPSDIILVDDSIVHTALQPENVLRILPYKGESNDKELRVIGSFLKEISKIEDVRHVMNRFVEYRAQIEREREFDHRVETIKKKLGFKSMRMLNNESSSFSWQKSKFEDIDENSDGEEVRYKVQMVKQQDRTNLMELNAFLSSEDDSSTESRRSAQTAAEEINLSYRIPTNLPSVGKYSSFSIFSNLKISKSCVC